MPPKIPRRSNLRKFNAARAVNTYALERVISGGQVGADIAGLRAAQAAGIPTGGFMPLGFLTLDGMRPEYAEEFGLREASTGTYRVRTELNVRQADATIRIAYRWHSPGELATLRALRVHDRPYLDVDPRKPVEPSEVAAWLRVLDVKVLNIAGNADVHLEPFVEEYLSEVFKCLASK